MNKVQIDIVCKVRRLFVKMGHININWDTVPLYTKMCPTLYILSKHGTYLYTKYLLQGK